MCQAGGRRRGGFFFNDTATTEIYTLSLHDALPILGIGDLVYSNGEWENYDPRFFIPYKNLTRNLRSEEHSLNSSHVVISYAVFRLYKTTDHNYTFHICMYFLTPIYLCS